MKRPRTALLLLAALLLPPPPLTANETVSPGFWQRALCYLPNRALDLLDIFRLRFSVGPGLGVGARFTDYAAFYVGSEDTAWIGLPGPRYPQPIAPPWGRDQRKGLVLLGIDATDDTPHPPRYGVTEIGAGAHLGYIGVDAGLGLFELFDFLAGWFGVDPRGDDLPRPPPASLPHGSVLLPLPAEIEGDLPPKPATFDSWSQRVLHLRHQAPLRLSNRLHAFDQQFAEPGAPPRPPARRRGPPGGHPRPTRHGPPPDYRLKPSLRLHIDLPNLEQRVRLFLDSADDDDLPGRGLDERRDQGFTLGIRRLFRRFAYTDLGVRTRSPPNLFARAGWRPTWTWGKWFHQFDQRLFWESDDGFGLLTSYQFHRWVSPHWITRSLSAGRFAEGTDGYEWQQSLGLSHLPLLARKKASGAYASPADALHGNGISASLFGSDDASTQARLQLTLRRPLFLDILVFEVSPGLQWRNELHWRTEYRLDCGLVMYF